MVNKKLNISDEERLKRNNKNKQKWNEKQKLNSPIKYKTMKAKNMKIFRLEHRKYALNENNNRNKKYMCVADAIAQAKEIKKAKKRARKAIFF